MTILIKSSSRGRTCSLPKEQPRQNQLDDIIQSLKGLTLKLEIKVVGVSNDNAQSKGEPDNKNLNADKTKVSSGNQMGGKQPTIDLEISRDSLAATIQVTKAEVVSQAAEKKMPEERPSESKVEVKSPPPPVQPPQPPVQSLQPEVTKPAFQEFKTVPPVVPVPMPQPKQSIPTPILTKELDVQAKEAEPKVAAKDKLDHLKERQGSFEVGSAVVSYCISSDSEANPPTANVAFDNDKLVEIVNILNSSFDKIESSPAPEKVEVGDVLLAKSCDDDSYYRSCVESVDGDQVKVFFFDWGLRETLKMNRLRPIPRENNAVDTYKACAVKVRFTNEPGELLDRALGGESEVRMLVESYDVQEDCYDLTIIA